MKTKSENPLQQCSGNGAGRQCLAQAAAILQRSPAILSVRQAAIAMLLGCAACATVVEPSKQALNPDNFAKITPGKSTASEVRALLGPPANILRRPRNPGEEWKYPFRRDSEWRVFWVEFSTDSVVRQASEQVDFDRDPRYQSF